MSEREFDTYLTLLCRLLRLDASQREAIARELRDHLEERLADLKARGVERDEAVRLALEEFGDAAGLAAEFSLISRNVRRRWLVRATLGSMLTAAAVVLAVMALWPESQSGPSPATAVAQQAADPARPEQPPVAEKAESRAPDEVLSRRLDAEFLETPLADVLAYVADSVGGQFYVNHKHLAEAGIAVDDPVTLSLNNVRVDMVLDLVLDQIGSDLAFVVRDGIVMVSTLEDLEGASEVRVYNVRDLVKSPATDPALMEDGASYDSGGAGYGDYGGEEMYGSMSMPGGFGGGARRLTVDDRAQMLMQVIIAAVGQKHWQENGDYGTIAAYDGLIVINHNTRVHQQVYRLLEMMRAAADERTAQGAQP